MNQIAWVLVFVLTCTLLSSAQLSPNPSNLSNTDLDTTFNQYQMRRELNSRVLETVNQGLRWLELQQSADGLFHNHPGITGLVITAFLRHPKDVYSESSHPFIKKSLSALLEMQQENGGIYDVTKQPALPNYNTSVALMALSAAKNKEYEEAINRAQQYIKGNQQIDEESPYYGGIGYGSRSDVYDLSNLTYAIQALKDSDEDDAEVWSKAVKFLERCQNRSESNDLAWAGDDGGFIYAPSGESKAGGTKSYGSMTYAGLLSFIHAKVDATDPRVEDAFEWIRNNYRVDENPGMGQQGIFYHYHTMAKALAIYEKTKGGSLTDVQGQTHFWFKDLAEELMNRKIEDELVAKDDIRDATNPGQLLAKEGELVKLSYWKNEESRWMERDPLLVTAYAILALEVGLGIE